jgi:hypothetical protein
MVYLPLGLAGGRHVSNVKNTPHRFLKNPAYPDFLPHPIPDVRKINLHSWLNRLNNSNYQQNNLNCQENKGNC